MKAMSYCISNTIITETIKNTNDREAGVCPKCYETYVLVEGGAHCRLCGDDGWFTWGE